MMRVGSLIKLRPESEERYIILHKHTFPGVLERIRKSNIRNYSIYLHKKILFSYYEYIGDDFDRDMAKIGEDPVTRDWWKLTDPMQDPLESRKEGEWWASMEEIFHWEGEIAPLKKTGRMAFTARILDGFDEKVLESLKIAYPILTETSDLKDIQSFAVFYKEGSLYSYFEFLDPDLRDDIPKLQSSLKVEDELDWLQMIEVFHTD
jgi:L-rhamnose mutarotase